MMAEVAGLVIGTVALAGVFKDCVDLFSYICAARSLGRDYEILNAKLDVEKMLLLQWAESVRLLGVHCDHRLNNLQVQETVGKVLAGIRVLLTESQALKDRYGLCPVEEAETRPVAASPISAPLMARFAKEFEAMSLRIQAKPQTVSRVQKTRWAIVDKQKFDALVQELSYFVATLNRIVPQQSLQMEAVIREAIGIRGFAELQVLLEASSAHEKPFSGLVKDAIDRIKNLRILRRLEYPKMDDRRQTVKSPHVRTLQWALAPPGQQPDGDSITAWLETGSGIFWVGGKAGSGKSTLMKYLAAHDAVSARLSSWTAGRTLVMANFFFWELGSGLHQSQEGLFRSLLYTILRKEPGLTNYLVPRMWEEVNASESDRTEPPSFAEWAEIFTRLGTLQGDSHRFCFFIDGLDEYRGHYSDAIDFIENLTKNPNIKAVVSSRPIPQCISRFSFRPNLQLQDLTKRDITFYVEDIIGKHHYLTDLRRYYREETDEILSTVVRKAAGVFLWVQLACRSIVEGLEARDRIDDLRGRVEELPEEVESLILHIIRKIPLRYQPEAARIIQTYFKYHTAHGPDLPCMGLALVDHNNMELTWSWGDLQSASPKLSYGEKKSMCRALEGRLRSRCCGLLEIRSVDPYLEKREGGKPYPCFCGLGNRHDLLVDGQVNFLHLSVLQVLRNPSTWKLDCLQIKDQSFNHYAVLSEAFFRLTLMAVDLLKLWEARDALGAVAETLSPHELGDDWDDSCTDETLSTRLKYQFNGQTRSQMKEMLLYSQRAAKKQPGFISNLLEALRNLALSTERNPALHPISVIKQLEKYAMASVTSTGFVTGIAATKKRRMPEVLRWMTVWHDIDPSSVSPIRKKALLQIDRAETDEEADYEMDSDEFDEFDVISDKTSSDDEHTSTSQPVTRPWTENWLKKRAKESSRNLPTSPAVIEEAVFYLRAGACPKEFETALGSEPVGWAKERIMKLTQQGALKWSAALRLLKLVKLASKASVGDTGRLKNDDALEPMDFATTGKRTLSSGTENAIPQSVKRNKR